jgi:hypothetical protein
MIAFHCYRVYQKSHGFDQNQSFSTYEHLLDTPRSSRYDHDEQKYKSEQRLLHRTIRRPLSIIHRRLIRTPRTFFSLTPSISYPFVRRRNDGGRARTAFALYGLPFRTPYIPPPSTISSFSSLVAKAFVH